MWISMDEAEKKGYFERDDVTIIVGDYSVVKNVLKSFNGNDPGKYYVLLATGNIWMVADDHVNVYFESEVNPTLSELIIDEDSLTLAYVVKNRILADDKYKVFGYCNAEQMWLEIIDTELRVDINGEYIVYFSGENLDTERRAGTTKVEIYKQMKARGE